MVWQWLRSAGSVLFLLNVLHHINVCTSHEELSRVLLISLDGFRWDYLDMVNSKGHRTPNFQMLINNGVVVKSPGVKNAFVTVTMPNHYTLVTGLYEESHGITGNEFYDALFNETFTSATNENIKWWNGTGKQSVKPVWVTNDAAGDEHHVSGAFFWPGSDVKGMRPTYFRPNYSESVPFSVRAKTVADWFTQENRPINFGALYYHEPDGTGHRHGPSSQEMVEMILTLDRWIGDMIILLKDKNIFNELNIILTSDHGMSEIKANIYIDDYVDSSSYIWCGDNAPVVNILPVPGHEDEIYTKLKKVQNLKVYKKEEMDPAFHYQNNRRILPIIVTTVEGYRLCKNAASCDQVIGDHGYDNSLPDMHPIFIAHGPVFKKAYKADPFESVDLYPLLCHLLDIEPRPNNGSLSAIVHILAGSDNLDITMVTFVLLVSFSTLVTTLWCIGACWCQRGLRTSRVVHSTWKELPSDEFPLSCKTDGSKHLLVADDDEDDMA